ncbi:hypothetical protein BB560_001396 [Smittium megazygosporum]|uniref:Uncharacterized protein n=1 Tax=Smittium megazygosporum TaxID=133381 RepID=A0A2T9ZHM2_9FUNG|nr:hypothetical protein BB560_001396 [Smittium megazygosporum]
MFLRKKSQGKNSKTKDKDSPALSENDNSALSPNPKQKSPSIKAKQDNQNVKQTLSSPQGPSSPARSSPLKSPQNTQKPLLDTKDTQPQLSSPSSQSPSSASQPSYVDSKLYNEWFISIIYGDLENVKYMLSQVQNVLFFKRWEETPYHEALIGIASEALGSDTSMMDGLQVAIIVYKNSHADWRLGRGISNDGFPLTSSQMEQIVSIREEILELILDAVQPIHLTENKFGNYKNTSLHLAAFFNDINLTSRMLAKGALPSAQNLLGFSPIMITTDLNVQTLLVHHQRFLEYEKNSLNPQSGTQQDRLLQSYNNSDPTDNYLSQNALSNFESQDPGFIQNLGGSDNYSYSKESTSAYQSSSSRRLSTIQEEREEDLISFGSERKSINYSLIFGDSVSSFIGVPVEENETIRSSRLRKIRPNLSIDNINKMFSNKSPNPLSPESKSDVSPIPQPKSDLIPEKSIKETNEPKKATAIPKKSAVPSDAVQEETLNNVSSPTQSLKAPNLSNIDDPSARPPALSSPPPISSSMPPPSLTVTNDSKNDVISDNSWNSNSFKIEINSKNVKDVDVEQIFMESDSQNGSILFLDSVEAIPESTPQKTEFSLQANKVSLSSSVIPKTITNSGILNQKSSGLRSKVELSSDSKSSEIDVETSKEAPAETPEPKLRLINDILKQSSSVFAQPQSSPTFFLSAKEKSISSSDSMSIPQRSSSDLSEIVASLESNLSKAQPSMQRSSQSSSPFSPELYNVIMGISTSNPGKKPDNSSGSSLDFPTVRKSHSVIETRSSEISSRKSKTLKTTKTDSISLSSSKSEGSFERLLDIESITTPKTEQKDLNPDITPGETQREMHELNDMYSELDDSLESKVVDSEVASPAIIPTSETTHKSPENKLPKETYSQTLPILEEQSKDSAKITPSSRDLLVKRKHSESNKSAKTSLGFSREFVESVEFLPSRSRLMNEHSVEPDDIYGEIIDLSANESLERDEASSCDSAGPKRRLSKKKKKSKEVRKSEELFRNELLIKSNQYLYKYQKYVKDRKLEQAGFLGSESSEEGEEEVDQSFISHISKLGIKLGGKGKRSLSYSDPRSLLSQTVSSPNFGRTSERSFISEYRNRGHSRFSVPLNMSLKNSLFADTSEQSEGTTNQKDKINKSLFINVAPMQKARRNFSFPDTSSSIYNVLCPDIPLKDKGNFSSAFDIISHIGSESKSSSGSQFDISNLPHLKSDYLKNSSSGLQLPSALPSEIIRPPFAYIKTSSPKSVSGLDLGPSIPFLDSSKNSSPKSGFIDQLEIQHPRLDIYSPIPVESSSKEIAITQQASSENTPLSLGNSPIPIQLSMPVFKCKPRNKQGKSSKPAESAPVSSVQPKKTPTTNRNIVGDEGGVASGPKQIEANMSLEKVSTPLCLSKKIDYSADSKKPIKMFQAKLVSKVKADSVINSSIEKISKSLESNKAERAINKNNILEKIHGSGIVKNRAEIFRDASSGNLPEMKKSNSMQSNLSEGNGMARKESYRTIELSKDKRANSKAEIDVVDSDFTTEPFTDISFGPQGQLLPESSALHPGSSGMVNDLVKWYQELAIIPANTSDPELVRDNIALVGSKSMSNLVDPNQDLLKRQNSNLNQTESDYASSMRQGCDYTSSESHGVSSGNAALSGIVAAEEAGTNRGGAIDPFISNPSLKHKGSINSTGSKIGDISGGGSSGAYDSSSMSSYPSSKRVSQPSLRSKTKDLDPLSYKRQVLPFPRHMPPKKTTTTQPALDSGNIAFPEQLHPDPENLKKFPFLAASPPWGEKPGSVNVPPILDPKSEVSHASQAVSATTAESVKNTGESNVRKLTNNNKDSLESGSIAPSAPHIESFPQSKSPPVFISGQGAQGPRSAGVAIPSSIKTSSTPVPILTNQTSLDTTKEMDSPAPYDIFDFDNQAVPIFKNFDSSKINPADFNRSNIQPKNVSHPDHAESSSHQLNIDTSKSFEAFHDSDINTDLNSTEFVSATDRSHSSKLLSSNTSLSDNDYPNAINSTELVTFNRLNELYVSYAASKAMLMKESSIPTPTMYKNSYNSFESEKDELLRFC